MYKFDLTTLTERVTAELGLSLYDNFLNMLHPNIELSKKFYIQAIRQAIGEMTRSFPVTLVTMLNNVREYEFKDNFQDYLNGTISEDQIQLVPTGISRIGTTFISAYYWIYNRPKLYGRFGTFLYGPCSYFAAFPTKIELATDGNFTEDSYVYLMIPSFDDIFVKYCAKCVGEKIRRLVGSIEFGGNIQIAPMLDTTIEQIKSEIEEYLISSSAILDMWRK